MSWVFKIATDLIKEAMTSGDSAPEASARDAVPADLAELLSLISRHRAENDRNVQAVVDMLNAQNERLVRAMKIQQRWNYGITAGLVVVLILVIVSLLWTPS